MARAVRKIVETAGGHCIVKTSGKTGIHVYVPISAAYDFAEVRAVAKTIARIVNRRLPKLTSLARSPTNRKNRIYLDYARNSIGQTLAAPYSLRAYPRATVSTPLAWNELTKSIRPERYTMRTVFRRLNGKGDVWRKARGGTVNLRSLARKLRAAELLQATRKQPG